MGSGTAQLQRSLLSLVASGTRLWHQSRSRGLHIVAALLWVWGQPPGREVGPNLGLPGAHDYNPRGSGDQRVCAVITWGRYVRREQGQPPWLEGR